MASSRTGTAKWKNLRSRALYLAQREGLTHCPLCSVELDYQQGRKPNSAEVDHIVPWSISKDDSMENLQVICRRCNQSLGAKQQPRNKPRNQYIENIDFTIE